MRKLLVLVNNMMSFYKSKYDWHFIAGIIFIILGFFALITPLTPGALLLPIGLVWVFGKKRSREMLWRFLGSRPTLASRLENILNKIAGKDKSENDSNLNGK